jgi:hypothetical protein
MRHRLTFNTGHTSEVIAKIISVLVLRGSLYDIPAYRVI